ncbi:MAG: glutamine amidotransferase [Nitrosomonadaceae bacterium]|nr:glutamine amidotransferase [Nitrosomonadaceae bacterium]|tara:strand:- start:265 stop:975 length:711 start_codon:yes stop_codon:yes gene_type:complete
MKPIAVFRLYKIEGPGYLATLFDSQSIPWKLIKLDKGEGLPQNLKDYSGLVFMGGPMSANDNLPVISGAFGLIRQAIRYNIPVMGHCLGGQMLSKALGGKVYSSPVKEMGWGTVTVASSIIASEWFDNLYNFEAFHWHGEYFTLPEDAHRILSSKYCNNQAFISGPHIGMQCHLEVTENMIRAWYETGADEIANSLGPGVQSLEVVQKNLAERVSNINKVARYLYLKWVSQLTVLK